MAYRVPTRMGDGSLVHLTPGEIEAEVRAGVEVAVKRLGCCAEYSPRQVSPRTGGEAAAAENEQLNRFLHLFVLNTDVNLVTSVTATRANSRQASERPSGRNEEIWRSDFE